MARSGDRAVGGDRAARGPGGRFSAQPTDDDPQGVLSAGPRGCRVDDGAGPRVPASLSDAGDSDRADGTPVAAVGARPSAERDPNAGALGRAAATAAAGTTARGAGQGPLDAEPGGAADGGDGGRQRLPRGDRRFFRAASGGAVDPDAADR